ncbi:MAG: hypothetical protein ABI175_23875 [Polyangiales bacterium]
MTTTMNERERLEREANLVRAKLATTLDVLDERGHELVHRGQELVDVKLQVKRHLVPIAIVAGTAALALFSGIGYAIYRVATRDERRRLARRRLPSRVWNHPERVAQVQKPPVLAEIGRKLLVSTATLVGMSLIKRALRAPRPVMTTERTRPAMPSPDLHHT